MADIIDVTPAKKVKSAKAKKPKAAATHPKVSEMVNTAISSLKERGGSSLQAIKKYIAANYKVDVEKLSPFIKKYLKTSVVSGGLIQTKGKGATGSFRMGGGSSAEGKKKKVVSKPKKAAVKATKPKKPKAATPKKVAKPKKASPKKPKSSPTKKAKPVAKKAAVKKPKAIKLASKAKKPKASPKKAAKKSKK